MKRSGRVVFEYTVNEYSNTVLDRDPRKVRFGLTDVPNSLRINPPKAAPFEPPRSPEARK